MNDIEEVRERLKSSALTYRKIAEDTGVNYWWITKFVIGDLSGFSRKGFERVSVLKSYLESA